MERARRRFERWVQWSGFSDAEIARRLGCDASLPGKIRRGVSDRRPGLDLAHAIERVTGTRRADGKKWSGGPIRTEEWLEPVPARSRAA